MRALITGAAGFIGSHLSQHLLDEGYEVVGVDAFTEYYSAAVKRRNVSGLAEAAAFTLLESDLATEDPEPMLDGCDVVFHLAGQPGVRPSWGPEFRQYLERNVWVTQRLLEGARAHMPRAFVFASSSSVYGQGGGAGPDDHELLRPVSPYGVTKLAAEQLCLAYAQNFGVPAICLRYFTVYGPRQRPDMAFNSFITKALDDQSISVYGDGLQTRDFTYVDDIVDATFRAATCGSHGVALDVGGGSRTSVLDVIRHLETLLRRAIRVRHLPEVPGDVRHTGANLALAEQLLGYRPSVSLEEGLSRQVDWALGAIANEQN